MAVTIEQISEHDAVGLARIARKAYRDHYTHLWHDGGAWYVRTRFNARKLRKEIADENALFYFACLDGERVGFLKLNIHKSYPGLEGKECLELERIYLTRAGQGKGVGKALVKFTLDYARKIGKEAVFLKAMDTSDAVGFYEKMGFRTFDTYRLSFPMMKEELREMVVMANLLMVNG